MEHEVVPLKNGNKSKHQSSIDTTEKSPFIITCSPKPVFHTESVLKAYNVKSIWILILITFLIGLIVLCVVITRSVYHILEIKEQETYNDTLGVDKGLLK